MLKQYFKERKKGMFPEIKDWTLDYNELRFKKDVNAMSWGEWFWFHTTAYSLIHFGSNVVTTILFACLIPFALYLKVGFIAPVFAVISLYYLIDLAIKIKNRERIKYLNFYDVFLREEK